jgi:Coenzyme PQQ synthesis protein D (PqqD)
MTELRLQGSSVDWREVEGELIALARAESVYLAGNASAAILWRALADGTTETNLQALLVSTYGISAEAARADVAAFLADLGARGLLEAA